MKFNLVKTNDFETDVRAGYYRLERNEAYNTKTNRYDKGVGLTFDADFRAFLLDSGVPEQYVSKVAYVAWQSGHAEGEENVLCHAYDLIEIFN
jgi:hypothetical protein